MRSDRIAKGMIVQILKTFKDRNGRTCLSNLFGCLAVLMEKINYFCIQQCWEGFSVASPLAAVMSGARTTAAGDNCSSGVLLGFSGRKLSLKYRLVSRWAGERRGRLYRRKEQQSSKGQFSGAQNLWSLEIFSGACF